MSIRPEAGGAGRAEPVIWLAPSPRMADLGTVLERLAPDVAFTADVAELAVAAPEAARVLVLDAEAVPLEDVGYLRRYVASASDVRVTVVGADAGARVARALLALPRAAWMAWPPDFDALLALAHGHDLALHDAGRAPSAPQRAVASVPPPARHAPTARAPVAPPRPFPARAYEPEPFADAEPEEPTHAPAPSTRDDEPDFGSTAPRAPSEFTSSTIQSSAFTAREGDEERELDEIQAILAGPARPEERPALRARERASERAPERHTHPARTALAPNPAPGAAEHARQNPANPANPASPTSVASGAARDARTRGATTDPVDDAAFEVAFRDTPVAPRTVSDAARTAIRDDVAGPFDADDEHGEHDQPWAEDQPGVDDEAGEARNVLEPDARHEDEADGGSAEARVVHGSRGGETSASHAIAPEPQTSSAAPFGPKDAPPWWRAQVADLADAAQRVQLSMSALRAVEPSDEHELRDHVDLVDAEVARVVQFARTLGFVAAPPTRGEQVFDLSDTVQLFMAQLASRPGGSPRCQFRALEPVYVRSDRALIGTAFDAFFWLAGACAAAGDVVRAQVRRERDLAEVRVEFPAGPLAGIDTARILEPYGVRRLLPELGPNALSAASAIVFGQGGATWLTSFPSARLGWRIVLPAVDAPARGAR